MREIKFRAKRLDTNKFVFGSIIMIINPHIEETTYNVAYIHDGVSISSAIPVNTETICQFTGLQDANGKDIYEGDVYRDEISLDDELGIDEVLYFMCIYFKPTASFCWISIAEHNINQFGENWNDTEEYPTSLKEDEMDMIKIIGNIYENPELLTK